MKLIKQQDPDKVDFTAVWANESIPTAWELICYLRITKLRVYGLELEAFVCARIKKCIIHWRPSAHDNPFQSFRNF